MCSILPAFHILWCVRIFKTSDDDKTQGNGFERGSWETGTRNKYLQICRNTSNMLCLLATADWLVHAPIVMSWTRIHVKQNLKRFLLVCFVFSEIYALETRTSLPSCVNIVNVYLLLKNNTPLDRMFQRCYHYCISRLQEHKLSWWKNKKHYILISIQSLCVYDEYKGV